MEKQDHTEFNKALSNTLDDAMKAELDNRAGKADPIASAKSAIDIAFMANILFGIHNHLKKEDN